ncbi:hypothetical protein [Streptomyces specialis]|uniref:hypothetical protein n=1 Tax=Streptomyces specialis TaxID=498367 RepID=UPI00073EA475|nr:hypothetical protein [Streptomyces specialis]
MARLIKRLGATLAMLFAIGGVMAGGAAPAQADSGNGWLNCVPGEICYSSTWSTWCWGSGDHENVWTNACGYQRHFYYNDSNHHDDQWGGGSGHIGTCRELSRTTGFWDCAEAIANRDTQCYVRVYADVGYRGNYDNVANDPNTYGVRKLIEGVWEQNSSHIRC